MGRSALRLTASIHVFQIRGEGVFLTARRRIWLRISLFGREWDSKRSIPTFPIILNQCCEVERLFTNAWNLAALSDILSADGVTIELIQRSTTRAGGHVLACYETSVQDFLFPKRSAGSIHYVTMKRTGHLKVPVQLSYSTQTTIEEVPLTRPRTAYSWQFDSQQEQTTDANHPTTPPAIHSTPLQPHHTTQQEDTLTNQSPPHTSNTLQSSFPPHTNRQIRPFPTTRTGLWVHLPSADKVPHKKKKPRVQFLDDTSLIQKEQPPFVVRRVDPDLISSRGYLSDTAEEPCEKTGRSKYHPIFDSSFGKPSVTVVKHATPTHRTTSDHKETQTPLDNRSLDDIRRGGFSHCDSDDDAELSRVSDGLGVHCSACEAKDIVDRTGEDVLRVSPATGKWRERIGRYSSDRYQPSYKRPHSRSHGWLSGSESVHDRSDTRHELSDPAERIHRKIDDLLRQCQWKPADASRNSSDEDELEKTIRRTTSLQRRSQRYPNRSVTVHLGGDDYWSSRMKDWTGRPHRVLFDETLEKAYSRLYQQSINIK